MGILGKEPQIVLTLWDACDEYLRDMRKAEKAKPEHIRHVRRVFEKNIAKGLELPKIEMGEIGILTVEETERLFRANEKIDPEVCGLMALGLFAGMRTSAIPRVEYNEITM